MIQGWYAADRRLKYMNCYTATCRLLFVADCAFVLLRSHLGDLRFLAKLAQGSRPRLSKSRGSPGSYYSTRLKRRLEPNSPTEGFYDGYIPPFLSHDYDS